MNLLQLSVLVLLSLTDVKSQDWVRQVFCDQIGNISFTCGEGLTVKFTEALYTRLYGGESCQTCCDFGDPSVTGQYIGSAGVPADQELGLWVYGECDGHLDLEVELTTWCMLQKIFHGMDTCTFEMSPSFFVTQNAAMTDPCVGIYKYLTTNYTCVDLEGLYYSYENE